MARIIFCKHCNKKVAEVTGQIIPNAVMLCGDCYSKKIDLVGDVIAGNSIFTDLLKSDAFFKNKGY
jgi:hypothetical protein